MEKDDMCPLNDVNSIRKCLIRRVGVPIASGKWINNKYIIKYFFHLIATQQIVIQTN